MIREVPDALDGAKVGKSLTNFFNFEGVLVVFEGLLIIRRPLEIDWSRSRIGPIFFEI